jgi:hypothetical protein
VEKIMRRILKSNYRRGLSFFVVLSIILALALPGCNIYKNGTYKSNNASEIANILRTKIGDNPPEFHFTEEAFMTSKYRENTIQVINKKYLQALSLLKRIGNDEKLSYLTDQYGRIQYFAQKMKEAKEKNDWIGLWESSGEVLSEGYYVLPYSVQDNELSNLYNEALNTYKIAEYRVEQLSQKALELEHSSKISFDDWLSLSYVENNIEYDIKSNLFKQIDSLLSRYVSLSQELNGNTQQETNNNSPPIDIEMARSLGGALSDLWMVEDELDRSEIIINAIKMGKDSEKSKKEVLDFYRKKAEKAVEDMANKTQDKSWGKEIYTYATGSYNDAKRLEKEGFYSLALVRYQSAYIFSMLSKDWAEYPDIIDYQDVKAENVSVEDLVKAWKDSVEEFEKIKVTLDKYSKEGKVFFNIRYLTDGFYKSWFRGGDGSLRTFIESQTHWEISSNIAYMNIGPVPVALKIIEEDLENLSAKDGP